jgi:ABC-type sugar transport system substrate-binding protein
MQLLRKLLTAAAAGLMLVFAAQPGAAQGKDPSETLKVVFLIHFTCGNVLLAAPTFGAKEAGKLFNIDVAVQCADGDLETHVDLIEAAIAIGVDGIVDNTVTADTFREVFQKARDQGITVVSWAQEDPGSAAQAFYGQDFVESGYLIAKRMIKDHGLGEGDFCLTPVELPELMYANLRYEGVKKGLDEAGVGSEMIGTGVQVAENQNTIAEYLVGHPETDCIIGLGGVPTSAAPQAAEEAGMEGLPNGGFDVTPQIMENINAGRTTATMDQQMFLQGFLPVMAVAFHQRYGLAPSSVNTGTGVVDKSNAFLAEKYATTYR